MRFFYQLIPIWTSFATLIAAVTPLPDTEALRSTSASTSTSASSIANPTPAATAYPLPLPCTGEGCTVNKASLQDLNLIQHHNGTYFRVSKDNGTGTGLVLATAPALSGPWVLKQPIFGPNSSNKLFDYDYKDFSNTSLWTPEVHYINSTYYLYYSMFNRNQHPGFSVRVATSPSMADNSWTDHGTIGIPAPAPNGNDGQNLYAQIDQNLLADYDDNPYGVVSPLNSLVFGSFGAGLYGMQLQADNILEVQNTSSGPSLLIQDQPSPVPANDGHAGNNRTEGSFHMRINGWVFYFFSRGSCCQGTVEYRYLTYVCRATSGLGPYFDRSGRPCAGNANGTLNDSGTLFLESHTVNSDGEYQVLSPGSVGIVNTTQGPVVTYQYANQSRTSSIPEALSFGYNWLGFDGEGWPFVSSAPMLLTAANGTLGGNASMNPTSSTTSSVDASSTSVKRSSGFRSITRSTACLIIALAVVVGLLV